jgi:nucleoside-diphosphate-sugar epimerase
MEQDGVTEIVHAAGSLDYFNLQALKAINIDLTAELIKLSEQLKLDRFIFISTAFSCGFVPGLVRETLHAEPESDPTEYTSSKRHAEALVAAGSTPYLIVRPAIVIGDSHTGRYNGKPFGLYQFWTASDRFLSDRWREDFYVVASKLKLQVIHQDAFLSAFLQAYEQQPDNSFIHLVSRPELLPTVRDAFTIWAKAYTRPRRVIFLNSLQDAPPGVLDKRLRMWFEFTAVNYEIANSPWNFENNALEKLRANSTMDFRDASIETIENCQTRFLMESSRRIKAYHNKYRDKLCSSSEVIEVSSLSSLMPASSVKAAVGD